MTSAATTSGGASPNIARKPRSNQPSSSLSKQKMSSGSSTSTGSSAAQSAPAKPGAPRVVAYPARRTGEVSGLPFSLGEALLALGGVALLVLAGLALRRFSGGPQDPPSMPQVPVR